ncbi:hypothetical protein FB451DRAFT_1409402 [Mycena latifolia]|nr:hypothetical protein FB451DRAFT_1409402 [Mycena latifolia]
MIVASGKDDTTIDHRGLGYSGTSYSAPMAAGAIAAFVTTNGNLDPHAMKAHLLQKAVSGAGIEDLNGSPDIMLQAPMLNDTPQ